MTIAESKVIYKYNFLDYYFPDEAGYDTSFFINFLKGEKSVSFYLICIVVKIGKPYRF